MLIVSMVAFQVIRKDCLLDQDYFYASIKNHLLADAAAKVNVMIIATNEFGSGIA